ncbi:N-acetyltransferase [Tissierella sp. Yu-01]|uniref:N-acetyltransferase n=1 Tax=Tissierella sp. Yu-01 TaxID=3035694 RepID=UPI00240E8E8A|nr:N-acetyltransferase [Tissierella sp. Yu-01]WFA08940.1 N-acetyltransferase [Tissierella sp. Yu-01]
MSFIDVTPKNLEKEHICCAISDKKRECCVSSKKMWMMDRFSDGLVFKKLDARGKVFIEYIPAEKAWCPISAPNYMYINCFWVSGQFKGQGYANRLLEHCIVDAKTKGKCGLTVLSSHKKLPFLSDPQYLKHKGFLVGDTALPSFELLYLPFDDSAPVPKFNSQAKEGVIAEKGLVLYYSHQCPHTAKYVPLIAEVANQHGVKLELRKIETTQEAQNMPSPWATYSLFYHGNFVTNEILSEKKFEKMLEKWGL